MLRLNIEDIVSEGNVRHDLGDIQALADSIERVGLLQFPLVIKHPNEDKYILIAGHRRLAAIRLLGRETIDCNEQEPFDDHAQEIAAQWAENTQRKDLTDWEKAQVAYDLKLEGLKQGEVAEQMGIKKAQVSEMHKIVKGLVSDDALLDATASQFSTEALLQLVENGDEVLPSDVLERILAGDARDIWSSIRDVKHTNEIIVFYEEIAQLQKEWSEAGIQITTQDPRHHWDKKDQWGNAKSDPKVRAIGDHQFEIPLEDHIGLDCHMIYVFEGEGYYSKPGYSHYCMDFKIHTAKGKSAVKTKTADKDQKRTEQDRAGRKEDRDDKAVRRQQALKWMGKSTKQGDLMELALDLALTNFREDDTRAAIAMLGLTKERPTGASFSWYTTRLNVYLSDTFEDVDGPKARRWKLKMMHARKYIDQFWPRQDVIDAMEPIETDES